MNDDERHLNWRDFEGEPLLCQLCGEQMGIWAGGEPPDPKIIVTRCTSCGMSEKLDAILEADRTGEPVRETPIDHVLSINEPKG